MISKKPYWSWSWVRWFVPLPLLLWYSRRHFQSHVWYQDERVQLELRQRYDSGSSLECFNRALKEAYDRRKPEPSKAIPQTADCVPACTLPPDGWYCTREAGHDGPCPTVHKRLGPVPPTNPALQALLDKAKGL